MNFLFPLFCSILLSCSDIDSRSSNNKEDILFKVDNLLGTWVNYELVLKPYPIESVQKYFASLSGFVIKKDSMAKYNIVIQYGEQSASYFFKEIILSNDSLIGIIDNGAKTTIGSYDKKRSVISSFALIDKKVYSLPNTEKDINNIVFSKISNCEISCSIEEFALNEVLNLFPVTVKYDSSELKLSSFRDSCSCYGKIHGLDGYDDYQIIDSYSDKEGKKSILFSLFDQKRKMTAFFIYLVDEKSLKRHSP